MFVSQVANGIALPPVLVFMLLLVNKKSLMGDQVNSRFFNAVAWGTTIVMVGLTLLLIANGFGIEIGRHAAGPGEREGSGILLRFAANWLEEGSHDVGSSSLLHALGRRGRRGIDGRPIDWAAESGGWLSIGKALSRLSRRIGARDLRSSSFGMASRPHEGAPGISQRRRFLWRLAF